MGKSCWEQRPLKPLAPKPLCSLNAHTAGGGEDRCSAAGLASAVSVCTAASVRRAASPPAPPSVGLLAQVGKRASTAISRRPASLCVASFAALALP